MTTFGSDVFLSIDSVASNGFIGKLFILRFKKKDIYGTVLRPFVGAFRVEWDTLPLFCRWKR